MDMGGLEWRGFRRITRTEYLEVASRGVHEVRTDVYIVFNDATHNIKLRWGKMLELKVRLERDDHGVERWRRCSRVMLSKKEPQTLESLINILTDHSDEHLKRAGEKLKESVNETIVVECEKSRCFLMSGAEHVVMKISHKELQEPLYYESVCVEGSRADQVHPELAKRVRSCPFLGGYNSFLYSTLTKCISPTTSPKSQVKGNQNEIK